MRRFKHRSVFYISKKTWPDFEIGTSYLLQVLQKLHGSIRGHMKMMKYNTDLSEIVKLKCRTEPNKVHSKIASNRTK